MDYTVFDETTRYYKLRILCGNHMIIAFVNYSGTLYTCIYRAILRDYLTARTHGSRIQIRYIGKLVPTINNLTDTPGKRNPLRCRGYDYDEKNRAVLPAQSVLQADVWQFLNTDNTDII